MKLIPSFVGVLFFCCLTVMLLIQIFGVDKQSTTNPQFTAVTANSKLSQMVLDNSGKPDRKSHRDYFEPPKNWKEFILQSKLLLAPKVEEMEVSEDSDPQLIIIVTSSLPNFERRDAIRKTWANWLFERKYVYFIVGKSEAKSVDKENVEKRINEESNANGDIIQYDFIDSYYNLTYKSLFMLRFFNEHILNLRSEVNLVAKSFHHVSNETTQIKRPIFLLKTDDDMFIHVENMFKLIDRFVGYVRQVSEDRSDLQLEYFTLLLGCLIRKASPVRNKRDKYFVPLALYPKKHYPDYLSGTAYLMSADVARTLFATILFTNNCKYFFLEDIFITGICASKALIANDDYSFDANRKQAIKAINNFGFKFLRFDPKKNMCYYKKSNTFTGHRLTPNELRDIWKVFNSKNITNIPCEKSKPKMNAIGAKMVIKHKRG